MGRSLDLSANSFQAANTNVPPMAVVSKTVSDSDIPKTLAPSACASATEDPSIASRSRVICVQPLRARTLSKEDAAWNVDQIAW